jgi:hypothetical protein
MSKTERFITAAGWGFGVTLALAVMWLAFTVGHHIVQAECRMRSSGPIIWTPDN